MERKRFARLSQRLGALLLAGGTLWTVYATAGSVDAAGAWMAVKRELPLALLQWQLGDMGQRDGLSAPSVLMLSQAPILLSARGEISDLRRQAAEEPEDERPAPVTQPVREEPQPAPVTAGADNGVTAKTLIPTDPSGYTVCGKVYIRNTTQYTLSNEELLKPFAAELTGEAPQILILHSHGSEGYTPAVDDGIDIGRCSSRDTNNSTLGLCRSRHASGCNRRDFICRIALPPGLSGMVCHWPCLYIADRLADSRFGSAFLAGGRFCRAICAGTEYGTSICSFW